MLLRSYKYGNHQKNILLTDSQGWVGEINFDANFYDLHKHLQENHSKLQALLEHNFIL